MLLVESLVYDAHAQHPVWSVIVDSLGVGYFLAWSYSFYPQLALNYKRKRTDGLSSDFAYLNPIGFFALSIWTVGTTFSSTARRQYAERHSGHAPEVDPADLAFALHAAVISSVILGQVWWYRHNTHALPRWLRGDGRGGEHERLIPTPAEMARYASSRPSSGGESDPVVPSKPCQIALAGIALTGAISAGLVWTGRIQLLDWLYLVSTIKLFVSAVKWTPQVLLNWRRRSVEGLAIGQITGDVIGAVLSFAQLVISSVFISGDPGGIIANPVKLGLSALSLLFDIIILTQKYILYPQGKRTSAGIHGERSDSRSIDDDRS